MLTQAFRFLSLTFSALILGGAFCHVLEMPVKLRLSGADYMVVQQIYASFGPVGSMLEPAAIASAVVLTFLLRGRASFVAALTGAVALGLALLAWAAIVSPVNPYWAVNGPGRVPSNFQSLRWRWEWGHAVHAALLFLAFLALLTSVLMDVPARTRAARAPRVAGERAA